MVYVLSQATCIKQHQLISTSYLTEKFLVTFSDRCCSGTRDKCTCCCDSWNFAGGKWLYHWRRKRRGKKKKGQQRKKEISNFKIPYTLTNNHVQKQHSVFAAESLGMNVLATFSSISNFGPCMPTMTKSYPVPKGSFKHHLSSSSALYLCS